MQAYPEELIVPPSPLVYLVSDASYVEMLAVALKSAPAGITTSMVNMRYEPRSSKYTLPVTKKTKESNHYETYIPENVLKSNWMHKHQNEIPAVMVLVYDVELRQSPQDWAYTENQMVNLINNCKELCRKRNTELHVVLVQERNAARGTTTHSTGSSNSNNAVNFFDPSSDRVLLEIAGERVTGLRRKIGFDGNGVTLLYTGDIASPGSPLVAALDTVLRERSTVYYQNQTKRIKKLLTRCSSPLQTHYRVRLLFKLAYFQEFRGRPHKALKYYSQAYSTLSSILSSLSTPSPYIKAELFSNILPQFKTMADFINFKIMHAYLSSGNAQVITPTGVTGLTGAQAATMQFSNHIRTFESVIGTASVTNPFPTCTHYAWLSKQYVTAAELLQLNLPRPTLETRPQHIPCYYYHTAGLYAVRRRKAAENLSLLRPFTIDTQWTNTPSTDSAATYSPLTEAAVLARKEAENWTILPSEYVGGIPILRRNTDAENSDSHRDENAALMAIICAEESSFNHSEQIISLFERAQAMAVVDGGTGSNMVAPSSNSSSSSPSTTGTTAEPNPIVASFNRGSMFSYYPGTDASHSRFWRQWLIAEELYVSQGKLEQTARLLAPIAANCRKDQWWAILARIALRIRECAVGLQDKGLYIASSLDLLTASLSCAVPKVDDIFQSLTRAVQTTPSSSSHNHYDIHLPPSKPLSLNPSLTEFGSGNDTPLSLQPFPLPSHLNASMKYAGAPLLCSTVVFSRRLVQRGDTVTVRVITTSNLPRTITLDSLHLRFRGLMGDALLRAEIGIGTNILHANTDDTRAFDIVIAHNGTKEAEQAVASALPADNDGICHIDLSNTTHPSVGTTAVPTIVRGSLVLPAHGSLCFQYVIRSPVSSKLPVNSTKAELVQSLHSSVRPETVHIATTDSVLTANRSATANNSTSSALDRHSTNPFALSAVAGNATSNGTAASSSTASSAVSSPPLPVEMEPGLDTIVCEKVILYWSGNTDTSSSSPTSKGDTIAIHLFPRLLAPSNGDMRNVWLHPIVHQNTFPIVRVTNRVSTAIKKSTLLSIYEGQYLESLTSSQIKDILLALGTVLESCVAHMARTGATRTRDQTFAPRTPKAINWGYTEGKIEEILTDAGGNDLSSSGLSDNDLKGLQQLLRTLTTEGTYHRLTGSSTGTESKSETPHTGTIVYGEDENVYAPMNSTAMAGRLIHYHNVLILRPPAAQCEIMIDRPVPGDTSLPSSPLNTVVDIQQRPCAMGGTNSLRIHVSNNGKKPITGGVLFLSPVQLLHRTALVNGTTDGNDKGSGNGSGTTVGTDDKTGTNGTNNSSFAEVDITVATDTTDGNANTDSTNTVTNTVSASSSTTVQDNQRIKRAEECLVKMMKIWVPSSMLIVTKNGEITEAGKFASSTLSSSSSLSNGEASTGSSATAAENSTIGSKKDKKKKKGESTTVENMSDGAVLAPATTESRVSAGNLVPLSTENGILGLAIPSLPTHIDYSCTIQLQTPSLLELIQAIDGVTDAAKIISLHDYNLLHRLRCGIAGNFYAYPAVNETMMNWGKPDEWIDLAIRNPHSLVVTRSIVPIDIANPLHITCDIQPNVNYPLLDTAPITRYSTPFSTITPNLLARVGSSNGTENTPAPTGPTNAFIQKGTDFVSRLSISANTCENVYLTKVALVSKESTNNKVIQIIEDNLQKQLVDPSSSPSSSVTDSAKSSIVTLLNLQRVDSIVSNGTLVRSGQVLHSSLRYNATEIGNDSLGCFQATIKVGNVQSKEHTVQIPLPSVTIGSSPIRCDIVWPEVATVRNPVQLSVRITNTTPHFQALEVALQPPAVAWAKGNSTAVTTAHVEALQGLQVFEPLDRFTRYIVELLPNASKGVAFNLVASNPGFTILPSVVVKGTRTEGRPEAKMGPMANVFANIGATPVTTNVPPSTAVVTSPVSVRPPSTNIATTTAASDVLTVVPVGSDGVPAPRGIYVSAN